MNRFGYGNQRKRLQPMNNFQHPRYEEFPANYSRPWNSSVMNFEENGYQPGFRPQRGRKRQQPFQGHKNRKRNHFRDRNSWVLDDEESCFEEAPTIDDFVPVRQERAPFQRESSLPPVMRSRIHESRKPEFFEDGSLVDDFSSSARRMPRNDHNSGPILMSWSDSENDSKDTLSKRSCLSCQAEHQQEEKTETVNKTKDIQKLSSMIWSDDSDTEGHVNDENSSLSKGRRFLKHTIKSIPPHDGKSVIGDEGVFEIKVSQCTFCNIICLSKEKLSAHLKSKYHYKKYKNELEQQVEDAEWENANEE